MFVIIVTVCCTFLFMIVFVNAGKMYTTIVVVIVVCLSDYFVKRGFPI